MGVRQSIRLEYAEPSVAVSIELDNSDEKKSFPINKDLAQQIEESIVSLKVVPAPTARPDGRPTIQWKFEDEKSGLVVMDEIPPFSSRADMKDRFKIGDGAGMDYVFESTDALDRFVDALKRLVHFNPSRKWLLS